jgi:uncharacterized protein YqgC (DUF456 family)
VTGLLLGSGVVEWVGYALAAGFGLLGLGCLVLVVIGLPGTWLLLGLAFAIELVDAFLLPGDVVVTFGWELLALCALLALVGEGIEALAGVAGTRFGGGTKRGMVGAFVGGIAGAIFLTPVVPIPVVGTLVGAMLGAFLGAFVGEATGPEARGRDHNLRAALGAAVGKLGGTIAKLAIGVVLWVLLLRAALT